MKILIFLLALIPNSLISQIGAWDDAPKELVDLYSLAYEKSRNNETKQAIDVLTNAIAIDSNYRAAYALRGGLYRKIKDDKNALLDFSKALEIGDYNSFRTIGDIGYLRFDLKEYAASFEIFNKLEKGGVDIGVKYMKAISAYYLEEYEIAIQGFNNSILFHHNEGNWLGEEGETKACYYRANSKLKLNKYEEAIKDYDIVISRAYSPFYALAHYERGLAKKSLNKPFVSDFYKSCELGYGIACFVDSSKEVAIKLPKPTSVWKTSVKKLIKKSTYDSENDNYEYKGLILKIEEEEIEHIYSLELKASSISNTHKVVRLTSNNACIVPIFSTIYNKDGKFINHEILNHEYDWEQDSDRRCSITLLNFNEIEYIKIHEDECGLYNTDIVIECFTIE